MFTIGNMSVSERIHKRLNILGLSQSDVVNIAGVSKSSMSHWASPKSTREPSGTNLIKLAAALQCSPDWLQTGKEKIESNAEFIGDLEPWDSSTALEEDEVELPYFTEVELAAGNGLSQVRENHGPKLRFSRSTLRSRGVSPHNAACVKVSGASMEPVLPDGSTVGVDTSKTKIIDGKMFAIDHDGMLRVKTLYKVPGGVRFRSFNQAEYPDETYTGIELEHVRIIGQVFWYSVLI